MNSALGHAGVLIAFFGALAGAAILTYGLIAKRPGQVRQGQAYVWMVLAGAVVATIAMQVALITHDFSIDFVARNNSRSTPLLFTISGMWAALEGSILLWGLVLATYLATMAWYFRRRRDDAMVAWATLVALIVTIFFFGLMLGPADPFRTVAGGVVPPDGAGPNPLLQNHPLMAFHPPILYAGYVGFTVPFAFGMAALITGRLGEGWLVETRRWTLVAWGFLTTGIILGSWWSYEVLGWGGYWAWDPVENASLLPWLTATAYLHSVIVQERRGMLRIWNLSLLAATFALTILGTFFTRSGVLDSVHAFSESPLGPALLTFFAVIVAATCGLIFWRGDRLGSPGSIASARSREAAFLANNVAFAAFAFVVLLGTVFPLLAEVVNGERLSVGRPFFDGMIRPIALVLLFLMAVAPVLPWKGTTNELLSARLLVPTAAAVAVVVLAVIFGARGLWVLLGFGLATFSAATAVRQLALSVRRHGARGLFDRSGGGMIAHIGLAILAFALVASSSFSNRGEFTLREGESASIAGHTITFLGLRSEEVAGAATVHADVRIDGGDVYAPSLSKFPNSSDAIGRPSVRTSAVEDVYLTLVRTPARAGDPVVISVVVSPMVIWLWIGGGIMALGTVLSLVSPRRRTGDGAPAAPDGQSQATDDLAKGEPVPA